MTQSSTIVVVPGQVVWRNVNEETVILDLGAGMYFSLRGVGARIWELIQQPRTVADLCDTLVQEYEVSVEECERDLRGLFEDLAGRGLIEVRG